MARYGDGLRRIHHPQAKKKGPESIRALQFGGAGVYRTLLQNPHEIDVQTRNSSAVAPKVAPTPTAVHRSGTDAANVGAAGPRKCHLGLTAIGVTVGLTAVACGRGSRDK
jgi:hypothetical protein